MERENCEACGCQINHEESLYYNLCEDCSPDSSCCPLCGYEYADDDDGGICWDCDMEMYSVFSGAFF